MKVLMFSLDGKILDKDSAVQKRLISLAGALGENTPPAEDDSAFADVSLKTPTLDRGELTVFVPTERDSVEKISEHLTVYSFSGPRFIQLWKMWRKAESLILYRSSLTHPTPTLPSKEGRGYDLISVQDAYFLGVLGVRLSARFHIPLEVQVHGFEKMEGGRMRLARFVLSHATKIRVVSERLRKELEVLSSKLKGKIYDLPVYTQIEAPARQQKRKTVAYPFTFLTVGRLVPVKNIGLQIRALAKVAEKIPHVRLRVVGDGPELKNLQQTTNNLQLTDKVVFEGEQKGVGSYYEEADALLLTSDSEGWGRVALEAAAFHLPIIMTNVGLANEILHHDTECIVIPVGDEDQLYEAMKEVVEHPELRARLGEAAFRAFKSLPSAEEQIRKQVEAWRSFR